MYLYLSIYLSKYLKQKIYFYILYILCLIFGILRSYEKVVGPVEQVEKAEH